jgi:hypothetical protein
MQPKNFESVLKSLNNMIENKITSFLNSKEGKIWFESAVSSYIFPRNVPYKTDYAEKKGLALIEEAEILELDKAVNSALKVDLDDIVKYVKLFFKETPLFWIESDSNGKELTKILKNSKLYKRS